MNTLSRYLASESFDDYMARGYNQTAMRRFVRRMLRAHVRENGAYDFYVRCDGKLREKAANSLYVAALRIRAYGRKLDRESVM